MAAYFVTGVWKNIRNEITHLYIHPINNNNRFTSGVKRAEVDVIRMINNGDTFSTITWNYISAIWDIGEPIRLVLRRDSGTTYLRTFRDQTITNNLDNLINMAGVI